MSRTSATWSRPWLDTHRALLATMPDAETELQRVDSALSPRIEALGGTVESLHGEVDRLDSVTRQAGDGLGEAARAVQAQTQNLQTSLRDMSNVQAQIGRTFDARIQEMARSQGQIDETLKERLDEMAKAQEAIDARAGSAPAWPPGPVRRGPAPAADYEARLDGFSGMIARTLAQAEAQAREVATS